MARLKARWRVLAAVLAGGLLVGGAVAVASAQGPAQVRLAPVATDQLIASTLRSIAGGRPISGHVSVHVDLGLPSLPTEGLPINAQGALGFLSSLNGDHRLRLWHSSDGLRVTELLPMSERSLFVNTSAVWYWDFSSFTAYLVRRPAEAGHEPLHLMNPIALARDVLDASSTTSRVSVGTSTTVAGRPAYALFIEPRTSETLVGRVEIDIDAEQRLPLRVAVYARDRSAPPLSVEFTDVSFDRIDPGTYRFTPPPGAKVRRITPTGEGGGGAGGFGSGSGYGSSAALIPQPRFFGAHGWLLSRARHEDHEVMKFGTGWALVAALRTPAVTDLSIAAGLDLNQLLPFSGPLFSIRLVDRGDHGWLVYGLVPQSALAALEPRLP